MTDLQFHPVADIFPMMSGLEFSGLVDDIKANNLQVPVWLHRDGRIIDGRNRYRACRQLGIEAPFRTYEGPDERLVAFVVSLNLHRRHLDSDQRAMVGAKIANLPQGVKKSNAQSDTAIAVSQNEVAEMLKISPDSVQRARQVLNSGDEDLIKEAEKGRKEGGLSISAAAAAAKLGADERREFLARAEGERTARIAKQVKRDEAEARQMVARLREPEPVTEPVAAPSGLFRCVTIDPPWPMQKIEREERPDQGSALDYPTMPVECLEPCLLIDPTGDRDRLHCRDTGWDYECQSIECVIGRQLTECADEDCHLYLWVTHKFLPAGLRLLESWEFNYQCVMTWRKNVGITPYSWMYDTEHVLFARRGNLPLEKLGLRLSFEAQVAGHSVKPDVFYERVIAASPEPRLEMFARKPRAGFTVWGNEVSDAVV